jgi:hypothetical protein
LGFMFSFIFGFSPNFRLSVLFKHRFIPITL